MRSRFIAAMLLLAPCSFASGPLAAVQPAPAAAPTAPPVPQEPAFDDKAVQLDRLLRTTAQQGGAYILHYREGARVFTRGYGSLACAGSTPMPPGALFDGGSLTKDFTRAAIFKLAEEGRLKLDDRLGDIFRRVPADKSGITVAQLLSHRSGIPNFIDSAGRVMSPREWTIQGYDYAPLTREQMLRLAWAAPLGFPPGTREEYSNFGFQLLAAIIEAAASEPYETYVRKGILLPLGMTATGYRLLERGTRPIVQQCRDRAAVPDPITSGVWRNGVSWRLVGAGGMMTTAEDLQRWNAGMESGALFRPDMAERFRTGYFGPSYRCRTEATFVGGSNGMTRSLIIHLPRRKESLVIVSTHRERGLPEEATMLTVFCPK